MRSSWGVAGSRREVRRNFDMLLDVHKREGRKLIRLLGMLSLGVATAAVATFSQAPATTQNPAPSATTATPSAQQSGAPGSVATPAMPAAQRPGLNIVVLDPAHGGTDAGARGTGGIRESEVVLQFTAEVRRALEAQGFQVVQTREGNDNPSFDDRSAKANAQRGAVFVTLHISSTGLPATARVYVMTDLAAQTDASGLIAWEHAQAPFLTLSRKLGDLVQGQLALRFKGSPNGVQTAAVRQLRTTAAPAIAVEVSSVAVDDRADLEHMAPGVADAIVRGVAAFRPSYVVPTATAPSSQPGVQP